MPTQFRPSVIDDLPAIIALMQAAFDASLDAPFLNPGLLHWKYFVCNPAWTYGPRSYVLDQDGKLLAHGCIWPIAPGMGCLIDWASAKSIPGMGVLLARKIVQFTPVLLSISGSALTQKIMPKIGFTKQSELLTYARVLRPWRQFRTRPDNHGSKSLLRFGRNFAWSLAPTELTRGWTAVEAVENHFDFLMRCPAVKLTAYQLPEGSLLLSHVDGQTRIADLTLQSRSADDLAPAYAAAIQAALRDPNACELIALAHDGAVRGALIANGFQERMRRSVFVSDPGHTLTPADYPLQLSMLADDLFYLATPDHPYLT